MPSIYLDASEFPAFDVANATAEQVRAASALIDAYLRRPEGLQWMPDSTGQPAYMAGLSPSLTFSLSAPISPGVNVSVPLTNSLSVTGAVGDVVIIERPKTIRPAVPNNCEACVIASVSKTAMVLQSVALSHVQGTTVEFGLTISEQITLPSKRSIARLASWPIVRLISGLGSYRYGRRIDQQAGLYADQSVLALMQTFGGPPEWLAFDITTADFNSITNEVWIPSGIFLAYYSDVRLRYLAGFSQANIPPIVKWATAAIVKAGINTDGLQGGVKMAKAGDTAITRFRDSVLDDDTRSQLDMYRARVWA